MQKSPEEINSALETNQPSNPKIVRIGWQPLKTPEEIEIEGLRRERDQAITQNSMLAERAYQRKNDIAKKECKAVEHIACLNYLRYLTLRNLANPGNIKKIIPTATRQIIATAAVTTKKSLFELSHYQEAAEVASKFRPTIETGNASAAASAVLHHPLHNDSDYDAALQAETTNDIASRPSTCQKQGFHKSRPAVVTISGPKE